MYILRILDWVFMIYGLEKVLFIGSLFDIYVVVIYADLTSNMFYTIAFAYILFITTNRLYNERTPP